MPAQAEALVGRGVHELVGWSARDLRALAADAAQGDRTEGLFVLHPDVLPASALAPLITVGGRSGFVVSDMTDVDAFESVVPVPAPDAGAYLLFGIDRGDAMANWSPDEAWPALASADRSPLTLTEGLHWVFHQPEALQRGHCFMTIGTRMRKPDGSLDARTPAIWLSNGTGRDGRSNRDAPKVGWCWAGNRHTWLGFASAAGREVVRTGAATNATRHRR